MSTTTNEPTSILLLGAGTLGLPVLEALATHPARPAGCAITLAVRNPHNLSLQSVLKKYNITAIRLDIPASDEEVLSKSFAEYDVVIGLTGMQFPAGTQLKLARAAISAGVKRYFPWQFGVDYDKIAGSSSQDLFAEQLEVRNLLRKAEKPIPWTVVSTGVFADFLVSPKSGFGVVERGADNKFTVHCLGNWDTTVTATHVSDIGTIVARLVYEDPGALGPVRVAGQTVSYRSVASALQREFGVENVMLEHWSLSVLKKELEKDPQNGMKKYRVAFAEGKGVSWPEAHTWDKEKSLALSRLDDWIDEYVVEAEP